MQKSEEKSRKKQKSNYANVCLRKIRYDINADAYNVVFDDDLPFDKLTTSVTKT